MTILAKEIMTKPVISIKEDATLAEAVKLLNDNAISGAPVVDNEGRVVGILSESDFLEYTQQIIGQPLKFPYDWLSNGQEVANITVGQRGVEVVELITSTEINKLMSRDVVTFREEATFNQIVKTMAEKNINRLPIVDADEKLVGIITRSDVIKIMSQRVS